MQEKIKVGERYLLLLLGVDKKPIPTMTHIQKELFILSTAKDIVGDIFNFQKHYYGPYSDLIVDIVDEPLFYGDSIIKDDVRISLSNKGGKYYNELIKENKSSPKFNTLLLSLKMIRELYDNLTFNELLFLIYVTYPEYTINSRISDNLLKNIQIRNRILSNLLRKKAITQKRYDELIRRPK